MAKKPDMPTRNPMGDLLAGTKTLIPTQAPVIEEPVVIPSTEEQVEAVDNETPVRIRQSGTRTRVSGKTRVGQGSAEQPKARPGRPRGPLTRDNPEEELKRMYMAFSASHMKYLKDMAGAHHISVTRYIFYLVEADMRKNKDIYKDILKANEQAAKLQLPIFEELSDKASVKP